MGLFGGKKKNAYDGDGVVAIIPPLSPPRVPVDDGEGGLTLASSFYALASVFSSSVFFNLFLFLFSLSLSLTSLPQKKRTTSASTTIELPRRQVPRGRPEGVRPGGRRPLRPGRRRRLRPQRGEGVRAHRPAKAEQETQPPRLLPEQGGQGQGARGGREGAPRGLGGLRGRQEGELQRRGEKGVRVARWRVLRCSGPRAGKDQAGRGRGARGGGG